MKIQHPVAIAERISFNILGYRPREWQNAARRMEKESHKISWHKSQPNKISASLILDLAAGKHTFHLKQVSQKLELPAGSKLQ